MDKKEKNAGNAASENKKEECKCGCGCDENCKCGCQEGKPCTCGCGCCCKKKCVFKILGVLVIFLAGMGFNELLHCCPCPSKIGHDKVAVRMQAPMPAPMPAPAFADDRGNTIVIINTDGHNGMPEVFNGPKFPGKKPMPNFEHHKDANNPNLKNDNHHEPKPEKDPKPEEIKK